MLHLTVCLLWAALLHEFPEPQAPPSPVAEAREAWSLLASQHQRVRHVEPVGDFDGDGLPDLVALTQDSASRVCAHGSYRGTAIVLEGSTRKPILLLGQGGHFELDSTGPRGPQDPWLLLDNKSFDRAQLELRPTAQSEPTWILSARDSVLGYIQTARFAGDLDGDNRPDVLIAFPYAEGPTDSWDAELGQFELLGAVAALRSQDAHVLWVSYGRRTNEGFGRDIAPAVDLNLDGVRDVLVLVASSSGHLERNRAEFLCGRTGQRLDEVSLAGFEVWSFQDVCGEGSTETSLIDLVYHLQRETWNPGGLDPRSLRSLEWRQPPLPYALPSLPE